MKFLDRVVNFVDKVTAAPGKVAEKADQVNDKAINFARQLQEAADRMAGVTQTNLKQNKIGSLGRDFSSWLTSGNNMLFAVVGLIVIVVLIRRL